MFGINKELLAIKSHYFLRYAGTAPLTLLLPLLVRQKGISSQGIGVLWTVMPIAGLVTSSVAGTLADCLRAHRAVFLTSLICLTLGLNTIYFLPPLPCHAHTPDHIHNVTNTHTQASSNTPTHAPTSTHGSIYGSNDDPTYSKALDSFVSSTQNSAFESAYNLTFPMTFLDPAVDPALVVEEGQAVPPELAAAGGTTECQLGVGELVLYWQFWLVVVFVLLEYTGLTTCVMMSDTVCFKILGNARRHLYGQQRLWGTVGMGITAIVSGALVDLYSRGRPHQDFLPSVILAAVLMSLDVTVVARMAIPKDGKDRFRMGDVGSAVMSARVLLFLVTVYVMGAGLGLLWVFKLMYVEDVALEWQPNFGHLKLLQGLDMGIETFLGEVPFFFISGAVIQRLHHTPTLLLAMVALALRCCLYYTVTNPWLFLPIELLNGLSFGLFHTAMASYASHIAPPGAQATLQAITRACLSSGQSTAGFLGGNLYQTLGGATTFLLAGVFLGGYALLYAIIHLVWSTVRRGKDKGEKGYLPPSPPSNTSHDSTPSTCLANQPLVPRV